MRVYKSLEHHKTHWLYLIITFRDHIHRSFHKMLLFLFIFSCEWVCVRIFSFFVFSFLVSVAPCSSCCRSIAGDAVLCSLIYKNINSNLCAHGEAYWRRITSISKGCPDHGMIVHILCVVNDSRKHIVEQWIGILDSRADQQNEKNEK